MSIFSLDKKPSDAELVEFSNAWKALPITVRAVVLREMEDQHGVSQTWLYGLISGLEIMHHVSQTDGATLRRAFYKASGSRKWHDALHALITV